MGWGRMMCRDSRKIASKPGLNDVLLYIGGNLGVGKHDFKDDEVKFKKLGFDRVYPPASDVKTAIADLWADLKAKGKA